MNIDKAPEKTTAELMAEMGSDLISQVGETYPQLYPITLLTLVSRVLGESQRVKDGVLYMTPPKIDPRLHEEIEVDITTTLMDLMTSRAKEKKNAK